MTDMVYFNSCNTEIPRIVAAKVKKQLKSKIGFNDCGEKPRISGDLRIVDRSFRHLRYAEIREGCLVLYRYIGANKVWDFRIPLYNLNINLDSPKTYCQFSLSKFGEITPIATFQVVKQQDYKKWLKALAVEVIRQTPLNTLKFMDVLYINELLEKHSTSFRQNKFSESSNEKHLFTYKPLIQPYISSQPDSLDKIYSYDSGYSSLQSSSKLDIDSNHQKFEDIVKKFELSSKPKVKKSETSCFGLLNKFKRSNSEESDSFKERYSPKLDKINKIKLCNYLQERMNQEPLKLSCKMIEIKNEKQSPKICDRPYNYFKPQPDVSSPGFNGDSIPDVLKDLPDTLPRMKHKPSVTFQLPDKIFENQKADNLVRLITKCQIDKKYVPVREKRMLFESLNRFSFSTDNLKKRVAFHDDLKDPMVKCNSLSNLNKSSTVSVSLMKQFFESFSEKDEKRGKEVFMTHL